jgi:hypothetical protein
MMLANPVTVLHFSPADEDKSMELRQVIRERLAAGRDVLVVCTGDIRRRVARLALALARQEHEFPGSRLAVVAPNITEFAATLPRAALKDLSLFESPTQAIDWLSFDNEQFSDRTTVVWPMAC